MKHLYLYCKYYKPTFISGHIASAGISAHIGRGESRECFPNVECVLIVLVWLSAGLLRRCPKLTSQNPPPSASCTPGKSLLDLTILVCFQNERTLSASLREERFQTPHIWFPAVLTCHKKGLHLLVVPSREL